MSYYWVGGANRHHSYSEAIHESHPWIEYTSPYRDPLWAFVTVEPDGLIAIEGVGSQWVGPSPEEQPSHRLLCPRETDEKRKRQVEAVMATIERNEVCAKAALEKE